MTTDSTKSPYGLGTKFFYGVGSVAFGVKDNGFGALLLLFYNQALGLDARLAGLAIAIALVVDAFLDPLIGYASDHLHTRWGRRHPFMYAAAIPAALSYFFLFSPPAGLSQTGLFAYLLTTAIFVRLFIALFEIPNSALVAEFTQNYDERTSYLNWRLFFGWTAGLTMTVAAFGIFLSVGVGKIPGTQVPANYQAYGIAAAIIMFAAIMASALGTHRTIPWLNRPAVAEGHDKPSSPLQDIRRALSSRSAVMMLLTGMFLMLALGLLGGITPYLYSYFFALTPQQISILYSGGFLSAFAALACTPWLSRRFEKRHAYIGVTFAAVVTTPIAAALQLLGFLPSSGSPVLIPLLFIVGAAGGTFLIIQSTLYYSMSADVIEENEVRTGQREEGVFFAANMFVRKCASGLGVLSTSALLALAGFPEKAIPGSVPEPVINHLVVYFMTAFLILSFAAIVCVIAFRITRAQHSENLAVLARRRGENLTAHQDSLGAEAAAISRP